MYSYSEALESSLEYFGGDDLAAKVWVDKYCLKSSDGTCLEKTPEDMHRRIASEFARIEKSKYGKDALSKEKIFDLLDRFKYIVPQGSIMYGIGNPLPVTLSNCYVIESPEDSYGGICRADEEIVQISKRRGGVGVDISNLRPEGTETNNSSHSSTGIISFAERYSNSIREVGQNNRRGALMQTLSVHHPQVLDFARSKSDLTKITGANISIRLTDEFLEAVKKNKKYEQRWPVDSENPVISQKVSAREVWDIIVSQAHATAEPGILFWDNILQESPADCYSEFGYKTICTNPCSELPLCSNDSCRLLVLNLLSFVEHPFTEIAHINIEKLYDYSKLAQRLMDDIIDLEIEKIDQIINKIKNDPESDTIKSRELSLWEKIRHKCINGRRTGTGITGLGDTIAALGVKYGSKKSVEIAEKIYQTIKFGCYRSSVEMAKTIGAFPLWNKKLEENCPFLERFKDEVLVDSNGEICGEKEWEGKNLYAEMQKYGRRNIALLTIAPTGTVSTLTQTSSGIEPAFMLEYTRRKKINHNDKESRVDFVDDSGDKWQEFTVYHHAFKKWMDITGESDVSLSPYFDSCAEEIDWKNRVKLQGAIQKHCDHAISSTLNLPEDVTVEEVKTIYETAWQTGLKGITVYRKNCRSGVLIDKKDQINYHEAPVRPDSLECEVHHINVKGEPYFVFVGKLDNNGPYEVFAGKNNGCVSHDAKSGHIIKTKRPKGYKAVLDDETIIQPITLACSDSEEAVTRLVSTCLRHGAEIHFVCEQLLKTSGEMTTFAKALARALKKYITDGSLSKDKCPSCSAGLIYQEGCLSCKGCGFSKCS